ncbi:A disintegrin and metalloproteinase with thrombospondin motifs adt-1-like isoform X2 [Haliotis rubra]|uniref:A disintegrin and metalloproteinase with thrombospondin motifs adt-1-like isoform X2 n=1 Tax=Haliotis rubra TaxID=36100 RepID=UPI001EE5EB1A|nr:A disintegrin and metalloproteinase with thrombospondin motifs adt-1-like isoform X2 [Haliotis rubra]
MGLVKVCIAMVLPLVVHCVCEPGIQACEWESWGVWSSCTRTCAGLRTRTRKMCCGVHVPDCIGKCHRPNTSVETQPCATHCPNGGSYIDGYCHCPPLRYGICCERDETAPSGDCARHCTWINWFSWGNCSTNCGCATRTRKRWRCCQRGLNSTECTADCNFRDKSTEERVCTKHCTGNDQSQTCQLCSWNNWQSWNSCSQTCGGGQRSRSRSPCCCEGQSNKDCLFDCQLSENDSVQSENCSEVCFNNGSFSSSICHCGQGYSGPCCTDEVTDGKCTKCTLGMWGRWGSCNDSKNGEVTRRRSLCCRVGQKENECDAQCKRERHGTVDVKQCDLFIVKDSTQLHFMYTIIASVASVVFTSLVWTAAYCIRNRKCRGPPGQQGSCDVNSPAEMDIYPSLQADRRDVARNVNQNTCCDSDACEPVYERPQDLFM